MMKHTTFLLLLVFLSSCSRVQLAYNQLDWIIPWYIQDYFDFSNDQEAYLKQQVQAILKWHCRTQLADYSSLLQQVNADIQNKRMTVPRLDAYSNAIENYWQNIMRQAGPAITELLASMTDSQVEELFETLDNENKEWKEEFRGLSKNDLTREYSDRMTEHLERWFGKLLPSQQQTVSAWSKSFQPLGEEGLQMREDWQFRLRHVLARRGDTAQFTKAIIDLFTTPSIPRSATIQHRLAHNRRVTIDAIYTVIIELNKAQREHLAKQALAWIRDFDELACTDKSADPIPGRRL